MSGLFPAGVDVSDVGRAVKACFDLEDVPKIAVTDVEDIDWVEHVQKSWEPMSLGQRFQVLLPWHEGPKGGQWKDGRLVLRLEGGAAFGLGDHPTTQGAVDFLERVLADGAREANAKVLDYGTGSGVLAICAAQFGAEAVGVDVDADAVASAKRSWEASMPKEDRHVEFRVSPQSFDEAEDFAQSLVQEFGSFDVVVANILRRPLVALAPALAAAAAPGARLALTGLRGELGDGTAVRQAFSESFDSFREVPLRDGWLLVEAERLP